VKKEYSGAAREAPDAAGIAGAAKRALIEVGAAM